MGGTKRQISDDNSDAGKKKQANDRHGRDHEASTSRRPESASLEDGRAARDQQRHRGPHYEERLRYSAETEHDKQYNDEYHGPRAVWQDTRRHSESANRNPNHDINNRGRPHQRRSGWSHAYGGGFNRNHGQPWYSRQQSDYREKQRRNPDHQETVREPHGNISRSGSSRDRNMQGPQERTISQVGTSNRPKSWSPGQGSNPPTRRDSNQNASNQPVPQPSSPGQSSSMGPPSSVVSTPAENQPEEPSQNVPQDPVPPVVPTAGGSQAVQPSQNVPQGPTPSVIPTAGENQPEQRSQDTVQDPVPPVVPTAGGSQAVQPSPNETPIDQKFRKVMRESPWLYDRSRVECKDKALEDQSWKDVSSACGMTVAQCIDKLKQVQHKYRRLQRLYADKGSLSPRDMQFINDWQFLPYKKRTTTQRTRPTDSSTANQTQSLSTHRGVVQVTSAERLPSFDSRMRVNNSRLDLFNMLYSDAMLADIEKFSAAQLSEFRSRVWNIISHIQRRSNA